MELVFCVLQNKRVATSLHVHVQYVSHPKPISASRCCALVKYDAQKFADDAYALLGKFNNSLAHQALWSVAIANANLMHCPLSRLDILMSFMVYLRPFYSARGYNPVYVCSIDEPWCT